MTTTTAQPENPKKLFPHFITTEFEQVKKFYVERLGCKVLYDLPEYLHVEFGDGPELAFLRPDAFPDNKVRPTFPGAGVILSLPTPNADALHDRLRAASDVTVLSEPSDKPWGWRSFLAVDPIGVTLDLFHVVENEPM